MNQTPVEELTQSLLNALAGHVQRCDTAIADVASKHAGAARDLAIALALLNDARPLGLGVRSPDAPPAT